MATSKPRLTITFEPHQAQTLERVAALDGRSVSALVRELVESLEPGLRRVAELGEATQRATEEQRAEIRAAVARIDQELAEPLAEAMGMSLAVMRELDELTQGPTGPPASNQGGQVLHRLVAVGTRKPRNDAEKQGS